MTRRDDGSFRPSTREAASHPLTQVMALITTAALGLGTGAVSISRNDTVTGDDFARLEKKVDAIQEDVEALMIEKRGREWAEQHKVANNTNNEGATR